MLYVTLKMKGEKKKKMKGDMNQGMWAASRNWKNRNGIPSWSLWEKSPAKALILAQ